jgi:hypothetical protein
MAEQPNDFMRLMQELITNSATDQIRASRQFNELVQAIARGELSDREANDRIRQFLTDATSRYLTDLSRLTVSFFQGLRTVNRHYSDHFFDYVGGDSFGQQPANDGVLRRVDLAISATAGEDVQRSFVIENRQNQPCEVSFAVSEFTEVASGYAFRAPLQLQPARFTLRPNDEQMVTLNLSLLPELFVTGQQYKGTVLVRGYDNLMLALTIDVHSAQPQNPPTTKASAAPGNGYRPDDLTQLKGVGPNYKRALAAAGIARFVDLAQMGDAELRMRLDNALLQQARRFDWRGQAQLVVSGDIAGLEALRARLPLSNGALNGKS